MIDYLITWSVRHRWFVVAAAIVLAAWGSYATYVTPVDAIPDLSENQVIVFADWSGHSPQEIEDQVTHPLALALHGIQDVRVVRTSSDVGFVMVHVIFDDSVDITTARSRVDDHLRRLAGQLPTGVNPRLAPEAPATGQIFWYTIEGGDFDLGRRRALQDWYVGPQLSAVPGVAEVAGVGGFPQEYQIEIDPHRLAGQQVTFPQVFEAVRGAQRIAGGHVMERAGQEFAVQAEARLGVDHEGRFDEQMAIRDLENVLVPRGDGTALRLSDIARVATGPGPRRGVLEKDGNEVVGGVVMMRYGENPLNVIQRLRKKIASLGSGLPAGVRIVTGYDRTPLIRAATSTVRSALIEAILTATICVLIIMRHVRSSLVIAVTLPLATLASFVAMWTLRQLGWARVDTNIMSLAGLTISIGVLVDSSIVMTENVVHQLQLEFGAAPVRGDVRELVIRACQMVGRPIFFSVLIMLLSFLPVFGLSGLEGKMFWPLAFTKSCAMLAVAFLAITLVPALCSLLVRGRMRKESESSIVRGLTEVYRPMLTFLLDRPAVMFWIIGITLLFGAGCLGNRLWLRGVLTVALLACGWGSRSVPTRMLSMVSLIAVALLASRMQPLDSEFVAPLDEGVIMDMPITVPRISVRQSGDDLKARDMMLCRFPEVDMVMGKAGRADTPTDPAPIDMIETMVMLRPREFWPDRKLGSAAAREQASRVLRELSQQGIVAPSDSGDRSALIEDSVQKLLPVFDSQMREYAYHRFQELARDISVRTAAPPEDLYGPYRREWKRHVRQVNLQLRERAATTWTRLVIEHLLLHLPIASEELAAAVEKLAAFRAQIAPAKPGSGGHHGTVPPPDVDPLPLVDELYQRLARDWAPRIVLEKVARSELGTFGGEMDLAVQMPGWTNVWTRPIQNRVDMLNTGVDTAVGVRVLGLNQQDVVLASERIAEVLKELPGATNVIADPVRGKGYLQIHVDRERAAERGVQLQAAHEIVEAATGGSLVGAVAAGRERRAIRIRLPRVWREDEEALRQLPIPTLRRPLVDRQTVAHERRRPDGMQFITADTNSSAADGRTSGPALPYIPLGQIAEVRTREGPAAIKGENGLLRNYVRLDVRGRAAADFVADAQRVVAQRVQLPAGVYLEWTGRFERWQKFVRTLAVAGPLVLLVIFGLLYATYRDFADALLMMAAVPGSLAGGLLFQWLFGFKLSITVAIGYIACFGMATATGVIMLVYLRDAVARAGGLEHMTLEQIRAAVLEGAIHRLRPKLLTEATTILGLAPMLWATGVGAEVIRPMAAPVLGGILIADEVIDLFLPVMFYLVRRWRWQQMRRATDGASPTSVALTSDGGVTAVP